MVNEATQLIAALRQAQCDYKFFRLQKTPELSEILSAHPYCPHTTKPLYLRFNQFNLCSISLQEQNLLSLELK